MLANGHCLLDQVIQVFGQSGCQTLLLEDAQDLISGHPSDLSNAVPISEHDTDLGGCHTLLGQLADLVHHVIGGQLQPLFNDKNVISNYIVKAVIGPIGQYLLWVQFVGRGAPIGKYPFCWQMMIKLVNCHRNWIKSNVDVSEWRHVTGSAGIVCHMSGTRQHFNHKPRIQMTSNSVKSCSQSLVLSQFRSTNRHQSISSVKWPEKSGTNPGACIRPILHSRRRTIVRHLRSDGSRIAHWLGLWCLWRQWSRHSLGSEFVIDVVRGLQRFVSDLNQKWREGMCFRDNRWQALDN